VWLRIDRGHHEVKQESAMAVVGAFARVDLSNAEAVRARLVAIPGVTPFDLGEVGKVGLVIEADNLEAANEMLRVEVKEIDGVLGVWPVYAHMESEISDANRPAPG
jgi:nitrate reductase NapAB chaperone NapD